MDVFLPIQWFSDWLIFDFFNVGPESHLGESLNFFVYDVIKIIILLILINYLMAVIRHFLPTEKIRDFLTSRKFYGFDYVLAALFGVITPFCSCSSIPLFIGFLSARIPLGVTLTFLITSPLVNEAAIAVFLGIWGWKITLMYALAGMTIGIFGGFILGKLKLDKEVSAFVWKVAGNKKGIVEEKITKKELFKQFNKEAFKITKEIIPYVVAGVAVGALVHGFVPAGFFEQYISKENIFAVPVATILAIPLYANAVSVIPVIESFVAKGVPLGTALAFMMAIVGLSFPAGMILKKVMSLKLLALFFGVTAIGMMLIGYLFNIFF